MLRFYMPEDTYTASEKTEALHNQLEDFLHMEAFGDLLKILKADT